MNQQIKILPCPGPKEVPWSQYVCYAVISDANSTKNQVTLVKKTQVQSFFFAPTRMLPRA